MKRWMNIIRLTHRITTDIQRSIMKSNWFKQLKKRKAFLLNIWWQFVPAAAKINSVIVVYGATDWTLNFSTSVWTASCRTPPAGSEHREKRKVVSSLWHKPTEKQISGIFSPWGKQEVASVQLSSITQGSNTSRTSSPLTEPQSSGWADSL